VKQYKKRVVDAAIKTALQTFGAVIIEGARAVGKSTSAAYAAASSTSLDSSPEFAAMVQTSPNVILTGDVPRLIDEWQLAPNIWNAVKHEVDKRGLPGQFILTGSATPTDDLTRHSGAGRFARIRLRTMSLAETGHSTEQINFRDLFLRDGKVGGCGGPDIPQITSLIVKGGWPFVMDMSEEQASLYLRSYLEDTARLDVGNRTDRERVKVLIRALARNLSTERAIRHLINETQIMDEPLSNEVGISQPTLRKYLDNLTRIFILDELPAWATHIRSKVRQRVGPKWHFIDPSLAAASLGIHSSRLLSEPKTLGFFFESLVIRDLRIYADAMGGNVAYYRDETGLEVDTVIELPDGRWAGFEIKLGGEQFINEGATNLLKLKNKVSAQRQQDLMSLNIVTAGNTSYSREDGVNVIALGHLTFQS